jgi:hypothetical protein
LTYLGLADINNLGDLSDLQPLTNLEHLNLARSNRYMTGDRSSLSALTSLRVLDLAPFVDDDLSIGATPVLLRCDKILLALKYFNLTIVFTLIIVMVAYGFHLVH